MITPEQQLVVQFYESFGTKVKGFLTNIVDGPVVSNFFYRLNSDASIPKKLLLGDGVTFHHYEHNDFIIEIPKETRQMVFFDKLVKSDEFKNTKCTLPIIMGVGTFGDPMILNLQRMPHILITGRTGSGKSMFINCILKSLQSKFSPTECKFIIIDPIGVDFNHWDNDKHLLCPIIKMDLEATNQKLLDVLQLLDERYQKLIDNGVKNIDEYKNKTKKTDMPYVIVVIDEIADLMASSKKKTERFITMIAQKARAVGIHLIISTQKADKEFLTTTIKANMPTRVAFQARSVLDSMNALGERGAEQLLPFGDMLISDAGRVPVRIHTPYLA